MKQNSYPSQKQTKPPYVWAVVIVFIFTALAVSSLFFFQPDKDHTQEIVIVVGMLTPTIASILAVMKAEQTHVLVNSRMSEFIKTLEKSALDKSVIAKAAGVEEGRELANK